MVHSRLVSSGTVSSPAAGYLSPMGASIGTSTATNPPGGSSATRMRSAGVFSLLGARIIGFGGGSDSLKTNKGGTDQNETITVNANGIKEDTTNTDTVTAGDDWAFDMSVGGGYVANITVVAITFAATTNTAARLAGYHDGGLTVSASTNYFNPWGSQFNLTTTETAAQATVRKAGTMKNMFIVCGSRNHSDVLHSRVATAAGALTITVAGAGTTEDTTNADNPTVGQLIDSNLATVASSTNNYGQNVCGVDFQSTTGDTFIQAGNTSAASNASAVTTYFALGGDLNADTTESDQQITPRDTYVFSNLNVEVSANTIAATSTVNLRANTANAGSVSASIGSSATGQVTDTTHTYTAAITDEMNYQLVVGTSAAHTITITQISVWINLSAAGATIYPNAFSTVGLRPRPTASMGNAPGQIGNRPPMFATF